MDLLGVAVRPLRRDVLGCELHAHSWRAVDEDHVPVVVDIDGAAQHGGPECALGVQICSVKDDDLMINLHELLPASAQRAPMLTSITPWYRRAPTGSPPPLPNLLRASPNRLTSLL